MAPPPSTLCLLTYYFKSICQAAPVGTAWTRHKIQLELKDPPGSTLLEMTRASQVQSALTACELWPLLDTERNHVWRHAALPLDYVWSWRQSTHVLRWCSSSSSFLGTSTCYKTVSWIHVIICSELWITPLSEEQSLQLSPLVDITRITDNYWLQG